MLEWNPLSCLGRYRNPLVLFGFVAVLCGAGEDGLPHIVEPVFRFEDTVSPAEIRHVFVLANPTDAELRVTRVRATCGCTVPTIDPEVIPPGGEGRLELVFKTGNRTGMQRRHVFLTVDHPQVSLLRCSMEGNLLPPTPTVSAPARSPAPVPPKVPTAAPAKIPASAPPRVTVVTPAPTAAAVVSHPDTIYLRNLSPGTENEGVLRLTSSDGTPFTVGTVDTALPGLHVAAEPENEERTAWLLPFRFLADPPSRRLRGQVTVVTDRPGPPVRIRISGNVTAP